MLFNVVEWRFSDFRAGSNLIVANGFQCFRRARVFFFLEHAGNLLWPMLFHVFPYAWVFSFLEHAQTLLWLTVCMFVEVREFAIFWSMPKTFSG